MCVTQEKTAVGDRCGKEREVGGDGKQCVHHWGPRSCPHELGPQPSKPSPGKSDGRRGGLEKHEFCTRAVHFPF